jgi:hypothetical protein
MVATCAVDVAVEEAELHGIVSRAVGTYIQNARVEAAGGSIVFSFLCALVRLSVNSFALIHQN